MDPARYQRLRELVHAVADTPLPQREARLRAMAAGDASLVRDALALLSDPGVATEHFVARATPVGDAPGLALAAGTVVGRYRVGAELGRGGMGVVYDAVDAGSGAEVALKVLQPGLLALASVRERFLREARLGLSIAHENVVRVLDLGEADVAGRALHYLVMERVRGRTLRRLLVEMGTVPEALVREIGRQAAAGLAALHEAGVVHRDVKPENVLLTDDRRVRITDLGVAKVGGVEVALTVEGQFVGSLQYAAPEQAAGGEVGPAADLYALGVVLHELATGAPPFPGDDAVALLRAHADVVPARANARNPAVSDFLAEVVATLLEKRPADRFASAAELARVLAGGEVAPWWTERRRTLRPRRAPLVAPATPLVGRDRERDALLAAWREAVDGRGRVVYVEGEAGIGKSRLVEEVVRAATERGALVLRTAFTPSGGAPSLRDALSSAISETSPEAELARRLEVPPLVAAAYAAHLRRRPVPAGSEPLSAAAAGLLAGRLLRSLTDDGPVLWVVEDLHHATADALRRVPVLARAAEAHRLLFVVTARPGADPATVVSLSLLPASDRLDLARLDDAAVRALVAAWVGDAVVGARLADVVAPRADGVALFVVEMLRDLERRGLLSRGPSGAALGAGALSSVGPPRALRDLLRTRLAAVAPADRAVLDLGAVEGVEFDPDLLARARGVPRLEVLEALGRLERTHELLRSGPRRFRFDHQLLRDMVYEDLSPALRAELHARLADALEAGAPDPLPGELAVRVVAHRLTGPAPETASKWLWPAVKYLNGAARKAEAYAMLRRALDVPGMLAGVARVDALISTTRLGNHLGRGRELPALWDEAEAILGPDGDAVRRASIALGRGYHALDAADFATAERSAEAARDLYTALGDVHASVDATGVLGKVRWCQGRHEEARALHERAVATAKAAGLTVAAARADADLAVALHEMGHFADAEARYRASLDVLRAHGDPVNEAITMICLANVLLDQGRRAEAAPLYDEAVALTRRVAAVHIEAVALTNMGDLRSRLGDLEGARLAFRGCLELTRDTGERRVEGYALHGLGMLATWVGDFGAARRHLDEALALRRGIGHKPGEADTRLALAVLEAERGDPGAAVAELEAALPVAREVGDPSLLALALLYRATLPGGDVAAARAALAALGDRLKVDGRLEGHHCLWRAAGDPADLEASRRLLDAVVAAAPPAARVAMRERVPLHRAVADGRRGLAGTVR